MLRGYVGFKLNGEKIPVGSARIRQNIAIFDCGIDCGVSYANIVASEMREVEREISSRLAQFRKDFKCTP